MAERFEFCADEVKIIEAYPIVKLDQSLGIFESQAMLFDQLFNYVIRRLRQCLGYLGNKLLEYLLTLTQVGVV